MFQPVQWFQFADDAAVVTSGEKENQLLLNCFTRWCQWGNFIVRVDKCVTFGVKKLSTRSLQFPSKLFICNQILPSYCDEQNQLRRRLPVSRKKFVHKTDEINLINVTNWICYGSEECARTLSRSCEDDLTIKFVAFKKYSMVENKFVFKRGWEGANAKGD